MSMTKNIDPTTPLAAIQLEAFGDSQQQVWPLPGSQMRRMDLLSERQIRTIVGFAQRNFPALTSWGEAVEALRKRFIRSNRQFDFGLVQAIIDVDRQANADLAMTPDQVKLQMRIVAALAGQVTHWDQQIATRIAGHSPRIREAILVRFIEAVDRGQMQVAMDLFGNTFGRPQRTSPPDDGVGGREQQGGNPLTQRANQQMPLIGQPNVRGQQPAAAMPPVGVAIGTEGVAPVVGQPLDQDPTERYVGSTPQTMGTIGLDVDPTSEHVDTSPAESGESVPTIDMQSPVVEGERDPLAPVILDSNEETKPAEGSVEAAQEYTGDEEPF